MAKVKKGDILVEIWGYDQTNADFYKVLKKTKKTVILRQLQTKTIADKDGFMTGTTVPIKNKWERDSKPFRRTIKYYKGELYVKIRSYSSANKWDGKPVRTSWYA